ncbi:reverse transcriptase domain-containing protein, partial [Tanacetum coccineum]
DNKRKHLDWSRSVEIIKGIADSLSYLHNVAAVNLIHRDIKAANILLDDRMVAKMADFGTAKNVNDDNLSSPKGTIGYWDPQYYAYGMLSAKSDVMPPKRTSTSEAPAMTQAAIRKLVADSITAALEAQAATMANTDNTNRNTREREAHVARKCSYKEFLSCQPINFKGLEGAVGLIRWFKRIESVFSQALVLVENSFAQPLGIEESLQVYLRFKSRSLIKKVWPELRSEVEDEFYHLTVKGNDLKTYVRRFQELATLCPTMVPDSEKMMEVFIRGLPRSIEGNVTASKPQTLEEAINIAQRLMDQKTENLQGLICPSSENSGVSEAFLCVRKALCYPYVLCTVLVSEYLYTMWAI